MKYRFFALLLLPLPTTSANSSFLSPGTPMAHPGKDLALFFATDTYNTPSWRNLYAPVQDAREIAADLYDLYGFDTTVVVNPTKDQVRAKLSEYAHRVYPSNGQLLVFFSGHGHYIDLVKDGFYIPSDGKASREDPYGDSWLKYTDLRRTISGIDCPHTLLVMDACFSGTLDEDIVFGNMGGEEELNRPGESETVRKQRIKDLLRPRTRLFISSGVKDYVPDPSEFAAQFKAGLRSLGGSDGLLDIQALFHSYLKNVSSRPILRSFEQDQKASTFLFDYHSRRIVPSSKTYILALDRQAWQKAKNQNTLAAYREYRKQFPQGEFTLQANEAIGRLDEDVAWAAAKASDTESSYRDFITRFPNSAFKIVAEARLKPQSSTPKKETIPDFMVKITGGEFDMGCPYGGEHTGGEKPVHKVKVSDFYLGKTEVTFEEYDVYCMATGKEKPSDEGWGRNRRPVIYVSWVDAVAYCNWLSEQKGLTKVYDINEKKVSANWHATGYRLPTEAEWEYAARGGGKKEKYSGTNNERELYKYGNFCDGNCVESYKNKHQKDGFPYTSPVASFKPNDLDLYDMGGNVFEWCWDWHNYDYYGISEKSDPRGPAVGSFGFRVKRGGSWLEKTDAMETCNRSSYAPFSRRNTIGFRLCRTALAGG